MFHLLLSMTWHIFNVIAFFFFNVFIYLFINGCVGSSFLCEGFLQLRQAGAILHRGARASHYRGLSCCGAQAPDAQAQQLWLTGLVAPWHVGSSQTRARTRVPCTGRQILNHCATREAPVIAFWSIDNYKQKASFLHEGLLDWFPWNLILCFFLSFFFFFLFSGHATRHVGS